METPFHFFFLFIFYRFINILTPHQNRRKDFIVALFCVKSKKKEDG